MPTNTTKKINGYVIEGIGGFITVRHWIVNKDYKYMGTFFKFGDAKTACLENDFSGAYQGRLY